MESFWFFGGCSFEAVAVGRAKVEVRTLQLGVLFVVLNYVGHCLLGVEAALVDCVFGEVGFYDVEFAHMPPAVAIIAETALWVVV